MAKALSICQAQGWFVEFEGGEHCRVVLFSQDDIHVPIAYVVSQGGGRIEEADAYGKVVRIYYAPNTGI